MMEGVSLKPQAVFFDLFETLITEFENGERVSKRHYDYQQLLGIHNDEFKKEWGKRQEKRMSGHYERFPDVIKDILLCNSKEIYEESIQYLYDARMKEKQIPFQTIHSDIIELLKYFQSIDVKIGLISNCSEEEVRHWPSSELAQYFDDQVFSYEAKCSKPNSQIYRLACERLNVSPEQSIFVGDGGSNELTGALHVGFTVYHAVWFNTYINSECKKLYKPTELIEEVKRVTSY